MKKISSEETQALHAGCSKEDPKNFAPPQTPCRGADDQNLISWRRSLSLPTNPVWWGMDLLTPKIFKKSQKKSSNFVSDH